MPSRSLLIRQAASLAYMGPRKGMKLAAMFDISAQASGMWERYWRARRNRPRLTLRQAALFCAGRKACDQGRAWAFAQWPEENAVIDIVCRATNAGADPEYEFIQLKEVVPEEVAAKHSLQAVLDALAQRYGELDGITVGIHLNRSAETNLADLRLPDVPGSSVWLFGQENAGPFFLWGDILDGPSLAQFSIPPHPESPSRWGANFLDEPTPNARA